MKKQQAFLIADLAFGDSGKGTTVDYLTHAHAADLIVRYNGGPQAGHNVVTPDGRHHTFAQFGSGLFHRGPRSLLGEHMLIEPYAMLNEAEHLRSLGLRDALARTIIDARCRVIAPPQQIANRIRERARGSTAHGTCGMGVGETVADSIERPELILRASDFADDAAVRRKLKGVTEWKRSQMHDLLGHALPEERRLLEDLAWIDTAAACCRAIHEEVTIASSDEVNTVVRESQCVIFEGAQGLLLDERFGFHPHTTWSDITYRNADSLLQSAAFVGNVQRVGVMRTYFTRHGSGPFVTERTELDLTLPEPHNGAAGWQGRFRRGVIDLVALRYALAACGGVDWLAVTHLDRLAHLPTSACDAYVLDGRRRVSLAAPLQADDLYGATAEMRDWPVTDMNAFVRQVENALQTRVGVLSFGATCRDKSFR